MIQSMQLYLESALRCDLKALQLLSQSGGNDVYLATLSEGEKWIVRLMPYQEGKHALFNRLKAVDNPGIVKVKQVMVHDKLLVVCETFIEGVALDQVIKSIAYSEIAQFNLFASVTRLCFSLEKMYQEFGLLHLDIKPEHLIMTQTGELTLIDFGSGCTRAQRTNHKKQVQQGTLAYVAQSRQRDLNAVGPHVDLFALMQSLAVSFQGMDPISESFKVKLWQLSESWNEQLCSGLQAYAVFRKQWCQCWLEQYGHITNR